MRKLSRPCSRDAATYLHDITSIASAACCEVRVVGHGLHLVEAKMKTILALCSVRVSVCGRWSMVVIQPDEPKPKIFRQRLPWEPHLKWPSKHANTTPSLHVTFALYFEKCSCASTIIRKVEDDTISILRQGSYLPR